VSKHGKDIIKDKIEWIWIIMFPKLQLISF
jgi:hypothetical protein